MQKLSFYLLPNRIRVRTAGSGYPTENRQVYQRKLKIYKGIDNTIEFEVLNADSRKEVVMGYEINLYFYDEKRNNLLTAVGSAIEGKPGLMSAVITKEDLEDLDPQLLTLAAYLSKDDEQRLLYSDSQFDLGIGVELRNGFNVEEEDDLEFITKFVREMDRGALVSEIGNFGKQMNDDPADSPDRSIEVTVEGTFQGVIEVEATDTVSTALGNNWVRLEPWDTRVSETKTYSGPYKYVRFIHGGGGPGAGARFNVTVINETYSLVSVVHRGQGYNVGDTLLIKGSYLGGDDGVNDLLITVDGINESPKGSINTTQISWSGNAQGVPDGFLRHIGARLENFAGNVDRIIIRS
jgi:hypothetical protein